MGWEWEWSVNGHIFFISVKIIPDTVMKLYRFVVEIKLKAEFKDWPGPSNSTKRRGLEYRGSSIGLTFYGTVPH